MEPSPRDDKVRESLTVSENSAVTVESLTIKPHSTGDSYSFFEGFALRGIRVDRIEPGSITCSFTVPPRLTDKNGNMAPGAIANLVDEVGAAATYTEGHHMKVSVDMCISFIAPAKLGDELEIISRVLGHKGRYSGTYVLLRNKATGEAVAEGRHSLFGNLEARSE